MGILYYYGRRIQLRQKNDDIWKKRGELIRSARASKGLLQKDVANMLGVKNNTIAGYEAGTRKADIDTAVSICIYLGIDLALFCGLNRNFKFVKVNNENATQKLE
jgi:transcriptional regulator with XRE-family HTH domain